MKKNIIYWFFRIFSFDLIKKPYVIYKTKQISKNQKLIKLINNLIMSNVHGKDYIGEISDLDERFNVLYNKINDDDIFNILEVIEMSYYTELLKTNNYELKMLEKNEISLFCTSKKKLIHHDKELLNRYVMKIQNL